MRRLLAAFLPQKVAVVEEKGAPRRGTDGPVELAAVSVVPSQYWTPVRGICCSLVISGPDADGAGWKNARLVFRVISPKSC